VRRVIPQNVLPRALPATARADVAQGDSAEPVLKVPQLFTIFNVARGTKQFPAEVSL
jgi:hypothetical protein